ncbi:MAG: PepSY-associated TM helix domain-containing protein [Gemmatimonadota bacterium]
MRNSLLVLHRWVALVTSIVILIVALTGSSLVFEGAIDRGLNPHLWRVTPAAAPLSLDTLARRAQAAVPGAAITGFVVAQADDRAYFVQAPPIQIFIDPYTAVVLGTRAQADFNKSLPRRLHVLHTTLMAGDAGGTIVMIVTLAALLLTISGVVLWWTDKLWRIRWSASWKRIVFDLHHALGIAASLVLFTITASGAVIHSRAAGDAIARLDARPRAAVPKQPATDSGARQLSFDSLAQVARGAIPGASLSLLSAPEKTTLPVVVALKFPEDRTPGGRSRVYVDRFRGTVLLAESSREAERGTAINNVMRSVHTGDLLGKPTEAVWLIAALVLASQSISGFLMWWNGRGARAALARKSPS